MYSTVSCQVIEGTLRAGLATARLTAKGKLAPSGSPFWPGLVMAGRVDGFRLSEQLCLPSRSTILVGQPQTNRGALNNCRTPAWKETKGAMSHKYETKANNKQLQQRKKRKVTLPAPRSKSVQRKKFKGLAAVGICFMASKALTQGQSLITETCCNQLPAALVVLPSSQWCFEPLLFFAGGGGSPQTDLSKPHR